MSDKSHVIEFSAEVIVRQEIIIIDESYTVEKIISDLEQLILFTTLEHGTGDDVHFIVSLNAAADQPFKPVAKIIRQIIPADSVYKNFKLVK